MESLKLIIVGIVQGVTELLPISSSGHILILGKVFDLPTSSFLLTAFHLGTTLALLLFFREKIFKDILKRERLVFLAKILVSTIPAALVGVFFEEIIEQELRFVWITAVSLIVWGIVMIVLEKKKKNLEEEDLKKISWKQSIVMGLSQSLALIPGTSRSGITTIAGMVTGLNKYVALEYSFLLGLPILLGGFGYSALKEVLSNGYSVSNVTTEWVLMATIVTVVPFVVGYACLKVLSKYKKSNWLTVFGVYRIVLGVVLLLLKL